MADEPMDLPQADPNFNKKQAFIGLAAANVFAFAMVGVTRLLLQNVGDTEGIIVMAEFFIVPLAMGIISASFWKRDLNRGKYVLWSFFNFLFVLLWSWIFLEEGYICLIIVSPLLFGGLVGGAFLGRYLFRNNNKTLNSSVFGILLFLYLFDVFSSHDYQAVVRDELVIHATPEQIWPHVVAFEAIEDEPDFWMFQIKMPMPMETTVEGYHEGAARKCIFNDGIVFDEVMTTFEPNQNLTFDIVKQPEDPEIIGHIVMDKGQFLLHDNGDGTTTLVGTSWYRLLVFPVWYYDLWAETITRKVHLRVMHHIKDLSEANPADD